MAEPIGIASGLLALAVFASQSSVSLYQAVDSFRSNQRIVRELKEELQALDGVLRSLQETVANHQNELKTLNLPLFHCGKACKEFEELIIRCTTRSGGSRTSFRDWAKLQYNGNDVVGFKNMLAGYKSTISIALGEASLRTARVTTEVLEEFKETLNNTSSDLEEQLQGINNRLDAIAVQRPQPPDENIVNREGVEEELNSTQQCLTICSQAAELLKQVRTNVFEDITAAQDAHQLIISTFGDLISAKRVTAGAGATQWLGQMSDASLQQLSSQRGIDLSGRDAIDRAMRQARDTMNFEDQYGAGHKLS